MRAAKPTCDYLGCNPVQGQCLGFCDSMPIKFAGPEPLDSEIEFPQPWEQDEKSSMRGLATALVFSTAMVVVLGVLAVVYL